MAFLGLGIMGSGMVRRLLGAGFAVAVYNRTPEKAAALAAAGARVGATPADAAKGAGVVLSMVADDTAARAVWLGREGALGALVDGAMGIECSTVTVPWVHELAAEAAARGIQFLDAPVTGSRVHAEAGELNFLVGGAAETLERVRPVLTPMSKTITHLGAVGSGATIKLINNFVCGVQVASLAEALAMIERSGLAREQALAVLTGGAPGSPLVKTIAARMVAQDYTPNFLLRLLAKDLGYAIAEGERHSLGLATATAALDVFQRGIEGGEGAKDMSAVIEPLRRSAQGS